MDDVYLDPEKLDLFLADIRDPFFASGLIGASVSPAIEGVPGLASALQSFADHWDVDIDIATSNLQVVHRSLLAAKELIQQWDAGIQR